MSIRTGLVLASLAGFGMALVLGCSGTTGPDGETFPLAGKINVGLSIVLPSMVWPASEPGLYLHLTSRQSYDAGCYRFLMEQHLGDVTLLVRVKSVFRPSGLCTGELSPAHSVVFLGDLPNGVYALHLADRERTYPGLLTVQDDQLEVVFPDTTRFCFTASSYP